MRLCIACLLLGCSAVAPPEPPAPAPDPSLTVVDPDDPARIATTRTGQSGVGTTPDDPPPPPDCGSPDAALALQDVTRCAGLDAIHSITDFEYYAIGQAWGDFDNDGWIDLYVTDQGGPNGLYRNLGDGTFALVWQNLPDTESAGAVFVDYDNDGWRDLFVLNRGPNRLYRNEGGLRLVDVTGAAGLGDPYQGSGAAWGDFDGDGWLDLYVVNWLFHGMHESSSDVLYRSNGDGTFEDVTAMLDPTRITGAGFVASFVDYDDDGDLDIYVVNDKGYEGPAEGPTNHNVLFRNDGPLTAVGDEELEPGARLEWRFTEVSEAVGADLRLDGMGLAVGDYDNDGHLDLYVTDAPERSTLLRGVGDGTFADVTDAASARGPTGTSGTEWGPLFFDYDNDGWLDLFIANEGISSLLHNRGGRFENATERFGSDEPRHTLGAAYADYDRDGWVDVVTGVRGWGYYLFRNVAGVESPSHWLTVRLVGAGPVNRDAIGGRVIVRTSDGATLLREIKCGSSLGAGNDTAAYFGLGPATVTELEVRWPDGTVVRHSGVAPDRELTLRYGG